MAPVDPRRSPLEFPPLSVPPPRRVSVTPPDSTSPASISFTNGGCCRALAFTCPVFPGPKKSFFPPGSGILSGFLVLLIISISKRMITSTKLSSSNRTSFSPEGEKTYYSLYFKSSFRILEHQFQCLKNQVCMCNTLMKQQAYC